MEILFREELFPGVLLQKLQNGYNPVTTPGVFVTKWLQISDKIETFLKPCRLVYFVQLAQNRAVNLVYFAYCNMRLNLLYWYHKGKGNRAKNKRGFIR